MEKYIVEFEGVIDMNNEMYFTKEQVDKLNESIKETGSVLLFATTFAKSKYGNCIIGRIVKITKAN